MVPLFLLRHISILVLVVRYIFFELSRIGWSRNKSFFLLRVSYSSSRIRRMCIDWSDDLVPIHDAASLFVRSCFDEKLQFEFKNGSNLRRGHQGSERSSNQLWSSGRGAERAAKECPPQLATDPGLSGEIRDDPGRSGNTDVGACHWFCIVDL